MAAPTASQLKEAGNALFVKQNYLGAHEQYTEAIAIDDKNAILYLDASSDARQATELDPGYAKGWSRRASAHDALMEWTDSVEAWEKALNALPKANLSGAEIKQKEQYTASLKAAKQRVEEASQTPAKVVYCNYLTEKFPWQMASEMMPELEAAGRSQYTSSAWVIFFAHKDFMEGITYMKQLKKVPVKGAPKGYGIVGHTDGLTCISNGIMRDMRVFHMDCNDWTKKYNDQVMFECEKYQAWPSESLEVVIQQAQERQKSKGWNDVRPALAVTVRSALHPNRSNGTLLIAGGSGWILRAVFDTNLRGAPHVSVELYKRVLELLDWGRQVWKNVSKDNRGAIFESTFVRGVRVLYLDTLMEAYLKDPGLNSKFPLETLFEEAKDLLDETLNNREPPSASPIDPGFFSSFIVYPAGDARAMIGFYHSQMAKYSINPLEKLDHLMKAGEAYSVAGITFPQDDEKHCWYLNCALSNFVTAAAPLTLVDLAASRIREAMPKMQRIWANSAMAKQGRDQTIEKMMKIVDAEMQLVREGKKTMRDRIGT
ncbi:hypothetical protein HYDPIDRAFT_26424 [Hydnomerulius pinastri MD-312]|nr:hypothetical protein HYDPIDRAFT_26424 [Hydnomerulius pinastri MD-312]